MRITSLLIPLLAATGTSANGRGMIPSPTHHQDQDSMSTSHEESYPLCPEHYDTYCCMLVTPYTSHCKGGYCKSELGWSCVLGAGKVDSIRTCLEDVGGNKRAFCKRPGKEYFPSVIEWDGYGSFSPVLKPSDYRSWVKPGMHKPWTPSWDEIRWEEEEDNETIAVEDEGFELRKREFEERDHDMI